MIGESMYCNVFIGDWKDIVLDEWFNLVLLLVFLFLFDYIKKRFK